MTNSAHYYKCWCLHSTFFFVSIAHKSPKCVERADVNIKAKKSFKNYGEISLIYLCRLFYISLNLKL